MHRLTFARFGIRCVSTWSFCVSRFSELCTAAVDNLVFSGLFLLSRNIAGSMAGGRLISTLFNFGAAKRVVFSSRGPLQRELAKYVLLVTVSGTLSFGLIRVFTAYLSLSVLRSKLIAESLLFFFNFLVQRDVVFVDGSSYQGDESADEASAAAASGASGRVPD